MNSFGLSNQTQTTLFYNRLVKRYKHLKKYARRLGIFAYRLYDKDIPEISVDVDLYIEDKTDRIFAVLTEYERSPRNKEGKTTASLSEKLNTKRLPTAESGLSCGKVSAASLSMYPIISIPDCFLITVRLGLPLPKAPPERRY